MLLQAAAYFSSAPAPALDLLFIFLQDGTSCICCNRTHKPAIHIFNWLSEEGFIWFRKMSLEHGIVIY
jgi:hypothetical protein